MANDSVRILPVKRPASSSRTSPIRRYFRGIHATTVCNTPAAEGVSYMPRSIDSWRTEKTTRTRLMLRNGLGLRARSP